MCEREQIGFGCLQTMNAVGAVVFDFWTLSSHKLKFYQTKKEQIKH